MYYLYSHTRGVKAFPLTLTVAIMFQSLSNLIGKWDVFIICLSLIKELGKWFICLLFLECEISIKVGTKKSFN